MHSVSHVIRSRSLTFVAPAMSVLEVAQQMTRSGVGAVPVIEGDRLVGIFSERDLMARVVVPGLESKCTPVEKVMTRDVITADLSDPTEVCVEKMQARRCRHLPVLEHDRVIAMLSMRDFLRDEIEERDAEIRDLRAYLHQPGPV